MQHIKAFIIKRFCYLILEEEVLMFSNLDLENLVTPVDAVKLQQILQDVKYNQSQIDYLVD